MIDSMSGSALKILVLVAWFCTVSVRHLQAQSGWVIVDGVMAGTRTAPSAFFRAPAEVAVDGAGRIMVSDRQGRLCVIEMGSAPGLTWDRPGSAFWGLAWEEERKRTYVSDYSGHAIRVFDPHRGEIAALGHEGVAPGQWRNPAGLGWDAQGRLLVADQNNHRIQRLESDGETWTVMGGHGNDPGRFRWPTDVAAATNGDLYVVEYGNERLQHFCAKSQNWTPIGGPGKEPGSFKEPRSIAVDRDGCVWVADTGNRRLQVFDPQTFAWTIVDAKALERRLFNPVGVHALPDGTVAVTDMARKAVWLLAARERTARLKVMVEPESMAGIAMWRVDGGRWRLPSTNTYVMAGARTLLFSPVPGQRPVEPLALTLTPGSERIVTARYSRVTGRP